MERSLMRKVIVIACILFSLRVNLSALAFPPSALERPLPARSSFESTEREEAEKEANDMAATVFAFAVIGIGVLYYWANAVQFFDYPYCEESSPIDGNYITRGSRDGILVKDAGFSKNRFAFSTSVTYFHGFGLGNETSFEGFFFPYFGPYFENLALYNFQNRHYDFEQKGLRNNLRLGGQLSLFQTNLLAISLIVQYASWYGKGFDSYKNGYNVGLLLRSYPVKPLVFELKLCSQNYTDGFSVSEIDFHFGVMQKSCEIFASVKSLDFFNSDDDSDFDSSFGVSLGLRKYFNILSR